MSRYLVVGMCAALTLGAAAAQQHTTDSLETVQKALAEKKAVLIDVREQGEWDKGRLKDAQLVPLSVLKKDPSAKSVTDILPKDKAIYLHCAAGGRCVTAGEILKKLGYDVRPLKDGYKALLTKGFEKAPD